VLNFVDSLNAQRFTASHRASFVDDVCSNSRLRHDAAAVTARHAAARGEVDVSPLLHGEASMLDRWVPLDGGAAGAVHLQISYAPHGLPPRRHDAVCLESFARSGAASALLHDPLEPMRVLHVGEDYLHLRYRAAGGRGGGDRAVSSAHRVRDRAGGVRGRAGGPGVCAGGCRHRDGRRAEVGAGRGTRGGVRGGEWSAVLLPWFPRTERTRYLLSRYAVL